ncbi:hypothetical protein [Carnobacterium funditum]|uniref:hypothetical protein n=1 Tax=Carnobacterium funditum TaxID=2752 RepID=UPI000B1956E1|nr:hypothetical protein [Carnobacterium funditum]
MLGLIAWILPLLNLVYYKKNKNRRWISFSVVSLSACAISLYVQLVYSSYLVEIQDITALMDTIGTIALLSAILLLVTLLLNGLTLIVYRNKMQK